MHLGAWRAASLSQAVLRQDVRHTATVAALTLQTQRLLASREARSQLRRRGDLLDVGVDRPQPVLVGERTPSGVGGPLGIIVRRMIGLDLDGDGEAVPAWDGFHSSMVAREGPARATLPTAETDAVDVGRRPVASAADRLQRPVGAVSVS